MKSQHIPAGIDSSVSATGPSDLIFRVSSTFSSSSVGITYHVILLAELHYGGLLRVILSKRIRDLTQILPVDFPPFPAS